MIHHEIKQTVWQSSGCTSWYKSNSSLGIAMFLSFSFTCRLITKSFKSQHHQFK